MSYVTWFCCGGKNEQEGNRASKAQKKTQKPQTGKLEGKEGERERYTNPYLKRWRLVELARQSQHSGNDGLCEKKGKTKSYDMVLRDKMGFKSFTRKIHFNTCTVNPHRLLQRSMCKNTHQI